MRFRTVRYCIKASLKAKYQEDWAEVIQGMECTMNAAFQKILVHPRQYLENILRR